MSLAPAKPLGEVLEKAWDADLFRSGRGLAPMLGWSSYHTLRSRGSQPGYPDRTLWRERVIFAELKRELTGRKSEDANRRPSPRQVEVLDGLASGGAEVYLWRPSDLDEVARVLSKRWRYLPRGDRTLPVAADDVPLLVLDGEVPWTPGSLWVPGVGRCDGEDAR